MEPPPMDVDEIRPPTTKVFEEFPVEVMTTILQQLRPFDILSMRKTCRAVYKATQSKTLWEVVLERTCDRLGMFKPGFPTKRMSLLELEHASTAPYRFLQRTDREAPHLLPYHSRLLNFRKPPGMQGGGTFTTNTVYLVPGGRYLVTSGPFAVNIWDLGYSSSYTGNPFPLVTLAPVQPGTQIRLADVAPSRCGRWIVVTTIDSDMSPIGVDVDRKLRVHQIDPTHEPSPKVQLVLDIEPNGTAVLWAQVIDEMVFVHTNASFFIWNWATNMGRKWSVDSHLQDTYSYDGDFNISGNSVIAGGRWAELLIWDFPELERIETSKANDLSEATNPPKFAIPRLSKCDPTNPVSMPITSPWQQRGASPPHLAVVCRDNDDPIHHTCVRMYSLRPTEKCDDAYLPSVMPVMVAHSDNLYGNDHPHVIGGEPSPLFNIDGTLVFCTRTLGDAVVMTRLTPGGPCVTKTTVFSKDLTGEEAMNDGTLLSYSFDPLSGRLVYFHEVDQAVVIDFLVGAQER